MNQPWVAIQRNPTSGAGPRRACLLELIAELRRRDIRPRLFSRRERLDAALADPAARGSLACIVAAGGDGTLRDVMNRHPGVPIALLPLGTENLVARYLGIVRSGRFVAEMIAAGNSRSLDACTLDDERFCIMASAGFDAEVVHRVHAGRRGHIRRGRYLRKIAGCLWSYRYPVQRVFLDDDPQPIECGLCVAVNIPAYAMKLPVAADALPDDGLLDVRLFLHGSRRSMLRYMFNVVRRRHERLPDVVCRKASSVRIEAVDAPIPVQVDGDPAATSPATIAVEPGQLRLLVPAGAGS